MKNFFLKVGIPKAFCFYRMLLGLFLTAMYSCKTYKVTKERNQVATWNTRHLRIVHGNGIKTGHGTVKLYPDSTVTVNTGK